MAIQYSQQLQNLMAKPVVQNLACDLNAKVRIQSFEFTQVGAGIAGDFAGLCELPAGRVRVLGLASSLETEEICDLGHDEYEDLDGVTVPASDDFFDAAIAVGISGIGGNLAGQTVVLDSKEGILIQAALSAAAAGVSITGYIAYSVE